MHNLLMCIGNFISKPNKEYIKQYLLIIKIIKNELNQFTRIKHINSYLFFIFNLFILNSNEIDKEMIKEEIYKNLINIYPFQDKNNNKMNIEDNNENKSYCTSIKLLILKILGKILSLDVGEESITQKLIDYGIIQFFKKIIDESENDFKIIKNVAFCLSNICAGNLREINTLYNEGVFKKLIKIGENIYNLLKNNINLKEREISELHRAFSEICYVFGITINNSLFEKLLPLVEYNNHIIIIFIIEALSLFKDNIPLVELCLNSLSRLICYEKEIEIFNSNIRVSDLNISFSEFLDRNGIRSILEYFIKNNNDEIGGIAFGIYDNIY